MLLAIHPGSPCWSNPLAVLQKNDFHNKAWAWWCDFEKRSITFGYFVLPAITMGSLLLNNSPSDLQNYVFHNKPWKCCFEQPSVTFCYFALTAASKGSLLLDNTPSVSLKQNICVHLRKCIFEQHSVTLRILTSNYPGKVWLWLFWRPRVSQSRRIDNNIS